MAGTLCLTFDNMGRARDIAEGRASGPDDAEPGLAVGYPRLLGLLDELDLRGTFFIEGWNGLHHPDRVEELGRRGDEVGLHGWVHERFASLDKLRAEQLLHDGTAAPSRIGLPPNSRSPEPCIEPRIDGGSLTSRNPHPYLCAQAQVAELVDALVSGTSG